VQTNTFFFARIDFVKTAQKILSKIIFISLICAAPLVVAQQSSRSPEDAYDYACASCHGVDGTGRPQQQLGFEIPLPDFTDCTFASREPKADWYAIAHQGGPVRAFDRMMPAFGQVLSEEELHAAIDKVSSFCEDESWPRGEFNMPRPLYTEKAFPEDEAVVTTTADEGGKAVVNKFLYEKRFGARSMIEVMLPFSMREIGNDKEYGIGDLALGVKHTLYHNLDNGAIFSGGAEIILPTGDDDKGFGKGTTVFEPFFTYGQLLPADSFLQVHAFGEFPQDSDFDDELGLRMAVGRTFTQGELGFGRAWTPMVEVLAARDLVSGATTNYDIVPQFQVSLNTRQHILFNIGVRLPVNDKDERDAQIAAYLLWDWFDGGFFDGW
jgi:hypothetical protein